MNSTADNKTKTQVTRRRAFSPKDRLTLGVFIGVPTALHVLLVWIPAVSTIFLSFTFWTGIHLDDIRWAGLTGLAIEAELPEADLGSSGR